MKSVAIVVPVRNERGTISGFVRSVFSAVPSDSYQTKIILVVNNSDDDFIAEVDGLGRKDSRLCILHLGELYPRTFAYAYLCGMRKALEIGADYVIEIDAGGSFLTEDLPRFLSALETHDVVLSNRFTGGGRILNHSLQRRTISIGGTLLSNLLLELGFYVPDMTSGFEAFSARALRELFSVVSLGDWISSNSGPGHFFQTEIRAYMLWLSQKSGLSVKIIEIVMGGGKVRKPADLSSNTVWRAINSLLMLRARRRLFLKS